MYINVVLIYILASEASLILGCSIKISHDIYIFITPLTLHFPSTRSLRYQPILHTLYYMLHCARILNTVKAFILAGLKFGGFEI